MLAMWYAQPATFAGFVDLEVPFGLWLLMEKSTGMEQLSRLFEGIIDKAVKHHVSSGRQC